MKSTYTAGYDELLQHLVRGRKRVGLTQSELADLLQRPQSFVSKYERRERRLDVVEFVYVAHELRLDPCDVLRAIEAVIPKRSRSTTR